ncbi:MULTISPECIES: YppG family protein [unclassified Bacillus (in: firmicutes)]|uniref:YppG family protein n=1 Tax=unclassified Bacillus (in: firmicutes) TaxID=185979 RepID=UPI001359F2C5|nr:MULTISPECIES: YppG family protein [unclassified Bacillus (in: firmicutes)]CAH0343995.1 hypothetical protein BCI9360_00223 [Bacillus sp. CECT 9360]
MFSRRPQPPPQRPRPAFFSLGPSRRAPVKQEKSGIMSNFRNEDGNIDYMKIAGTAQNAKRMYDQVKPFVGPYVIPLITRFIK